MTGVYVLTYKGEALYVGSTTRWPIRATEHPSISFDKAEIFECRPDQLLDYEKKLIGILKPKENVKHNKNRRKCLTNEWVIGNAIEIEKSIRRNQISDSFMEKIRRECGYSIRTTKPDIWSTIERRYKLLKEANA